MALQLFIWESGGAFLGSHVPVSLQIARFLAPAVLGYAAVRGLQVLFADQYHLFRARWSRDHVVVCGLGSIGLRLAERLHAAGVRVVAVESNSDHPGLTAARKFAAIVIGNAADFRTLDAAGIRRAQHLIAVCGSDSTNSEIAAQASKMRAGGAPPLTCHVHIADADLCDRLRARGVETAGERSRFRFFNTSDATGRALAADALAHLRPESAGSVHVLAVGLNSVTERLIVHLARNWQIVRAGGAPRPGARVAVTLIDRDASGGARRIGVRYPRLEEFCEIAAIDLDPRSAEFEAGGLLTGRRPPVTSACVSLGDDGSTVSCGLALLHRTVGQQFPITLCAEHEHGLTLLLESINGAGQGRIVVRGVKNAVSTPDLLLGGTTEALAREIHDDYRRNQARLGQTTESNASTVPWSELPDHLRESNRDQANHIGQKLAAVGYGVVPLTEWDASPVAFTPEEIEVMARMEHDRWLRERRAAGWKYDPGPKQIDRKTTPYLVEWDRLAEDVRELDRNTVRELPRFLARAGFQLYRLNG
jgi:voltage-gated potassium channel Kch